MGDFTRDWIVVESHRFGDPFAIHRITVSHKRGENGYAQTISLCAFEHGRRDLATKVDIERHAAHRGLGPKSDFEVHPLSRWERMTDSYVYQKSKGIEEKTYSSVWEFYKAIGYDHKRHRYVDKDGKDIIYQVLNPRKA